MCTDCLTFAYPSCLARDIIPTSQPSLAFSYRQGNLLFKIDSRSYSSPIYKYLEACLRIDYCSLRFSPLFSFFLMLRVELNIFCFDHKRMVVACGSTGRYSNSKTNSTKHRIASFHAPQRSYQLPGHPNQRGREHTGDCASCTTVLLAFASRASDQVVNALCSLSVLRFCSNCFLEPVRRSGRHIAARGAQP